MSQVLVELYSSVWGRHYDSEGLWISVTWSKTVTRLQFQQWGQEGGSEDSLGAETWGGDGAVMAIGKIPPSTRNTSAKSLVGTARPMGPRNSMEQEKFEAGWVEVTERWALSDEGWAGLRALTAFIPCGATAGAWTQMGWPGFSFKS